MNADKLQPGEHCASTSNRNFEGRQGNGGRTQASFQEDFIQAFFFSLLLN
jgi:hypothetical protein